MKQPKSKLPALRNDGAGLDEAWIVCSDMGDGKVVVIGIADRLSVAESEVRRLYVEESIDASQRFWFHLWGQQWAPYVGNLNPDDAIRYQYPIDRAAEEMAEKMAQMDVRDMIRAGWFTTPSFMYKFNRSLYDITEGRNIARFREALADELGMKGHPKFGVLWEKAWDRGHSAGLEEVLSEAQELVDLVK